MTDRSNNISARIASSSIDSTRELEPLDAERVQGRAIVPLVFAAGQSYCLPLAVALYSMIMHANPRRLYDIIVLTDSMLPERRARLISLFSPYEHIEIRFFNVETYIAAHHLCTNNEHIGKETYYRFLIQEVVPFYDKVVYCDCDVVFQADISELFDTNIDEMYCAAVRDIDYAGNLAIDAERMAYSKTVLGLKEPYDYFQAGVLLLNEAQLRDVHSCEEWMQLVADSSYLYDDQDVLNTVCQGKVFFLDYSWNVMTDTYDRVSRIFAKAPAEYLHAYYEARAHPRIIHYAGGIKPWDDIGSDFANRWWDVVYKLPASMRENIDHSLQ